MRPITPKTGKSERGKWTPAQRDYVSRCTMEGCFVCAQLGQESYNVAWHHQKEGYHGGAMRAPHEQGLSLCFKHHMGERGIHTHHDLWFADAGMSEAELVKLSQRLFGWGA